MKRAAVAPSAAILAAAVLSVVACGGRDDAPKTPPAPISIGPPPESPAPSGPASPGRDLPPGHPPVERTSDPPAALPAPPASGIRADRFGAPEGWQAEKPSSSMRLLQFRLPRADGDARDAEVTVFGTEMGSPEANIERWRGQFGGVVQGSDRVEVVPAGEKGKVHFLDVTGKYSGAMGPAAPGAAKTEGETRMIAAVVEVPAGRYYVKVAGPPATMGKWEKSIREFILESAKR